MAGPWEKYQSSNEPAAADGPWSKYQKPSSYQQDQSLGDVAKKLGRGLVESVQDYTAKAADASPFSGIIDKAASAAHAVGHVVGNHVGPMGVDLGELVTDPNLKNDFVKDYKADQSSRRAIAKAQEERSPIASTLGSIQGAASGITIPVPGTGMPGIAGAATRIGGNAALAALDQGTRGKDLFDPEAAKQAATVAGILGAGTEAASAAAPYISKGASAIADKLSDFGGYLDTKGNEAMVKAVAGSQSKAYDYLNRKGLVQKMGNDLFETGAGGFGNTAKEISKKSSELMRSDVGPDIGRVVSYMDKVHPDSVSGENIGNSLLEFVAKNENHANQGAMNAVRSLADDLKKGGQMSMAAAQDLKGRYVYDPNEPTAIGKKTANAIIEAIGREQDNAIQRLATNAKVDQVAQEIALTGSGGGSGIIPLPGKAQPVLKEATDATTSIPPDELLQAFRDLNSKYSSLKDAEKYGSKLASRTDANRTFSLGDWIKTGIATAVLGPKGGAVALVASKIARERGSSALAVSLKNAGNILATSPESLGRYAPILANALQQGNTAFATTHALLLGNDPNYRALTLPEDKGPMGRRLNQINQGR